MSSNPPAPASLIEDVCRQPDLHSEGTVADEVLRAMGRLAPRLRRSVETGCGRTTLVLSHLSEDHTVFAPSAGPYEVTGDSLRAVRSSPLLRPETVSFVEGPSQVTLPSHPFREPLDFAFLDGPHAYPFPELEYYWIYPHLAAGSLLVIDDIHIPTVGHLFNVVREDPMFRVEEVVATTAFLRRTSAPTFPTDADFWWEQPYNTRRYPNHYGGWGTLLSVRAKRLAPEPVWRQLKALRARFR